MKILVYGHRGWIGTMFTNYLKTLQESTDFVEWVGANAHTDDSYKEEILSIMPTHVVSFIGRTHGTADGIKYNTIDYLERPDKLEENIRDNLYSPLVLALICKEYGIHYTYIGTGCIYAYATNTTNTTKEVFTEEDEPNFSGSAYSTVKSYTDRIFNKFLSTSVLNLRIRMPISSIPNTRNFLDKILSYKKICSIKNSMTVLDDFIPIFFDMMSRKLTGTFNCTNPDAIEHNEILNMLKEIIYVEPWENFTIEEQNKILLGKRSNNTLDTSKLTELYPSIPNIHDSMKTIVQKYSLSLSPSLPLSLSPSLSP